MAVPGVPAEAVAYTAVFGGVFVFLMVMEWRDWRRARAAGKTWRQWRRDVLTEGFRDESAAPNPRGSYRPGLPAVVQAAALEAWDALGARARRLEPWLSLSAIAALAAFVLWLFVALSDDSKGRPVRDPGGTGGAIHMDNVGR